MTNRSEFDAALHAAVGGQTPYACQRRLAGAHEVSAPSGLVPCASQPINIPSGLSKTAR